jgi:hypothetical protein
VTGILFSLRGVPTGTGLCGGLEADSLEQIVEVIDDSLVQAVKRVAALWVNSRVSGEGAQQARGQGDVDTFEEL